MWDALRRDLPARGGIAQRGRHRDRAGRAESSLTAAIRVYLLVYFQAAATDEGTAAPATARTAPRYRGLSQSATGVEFRVEFLYNLALARPAMAGIDETRRLSGGCRGRAQGRGRLAALAAAAARDRDRSSGKRSWPPGPASRPDGCSPRCRRAARAPWREKPGRMLSPLSRAKFAVMARTDRERAVVGHRLDVAGSPDRHRRSGGATSRAPASPGGTAPRILASRNHSS